MADDPIRREISKAFGSLDARPEVLDKVTQASRKELSRAATEAGADRDVVYIIDSWADETMPDHEVLANLQAWNRNAAEGAQRYRVIGAGDAPQCGP